jgi:hypothetical protein
MPYSGDPSDSEIDAVRFWAQDTGTPPLLTDAEIQYVIDFYANDPDIVTSPVLVAAVCCDRIASKYVGWVNISADGVSYSGDQLQQRYSTLAAELRKTEKQLLASGAAPYVGGVLVGQYPDPAVQEPNFGIGMNDNPEGYPQRGGWDGLVYGPVPGDIYWVLP